MKHEERWKHVKHYELNKDDRTTGSHTNSDVTTRPTGAQTSHLWVSTLLTFEVFGCRDTEEPSQPELQLGMLIRGGELTFLLRTKVLLGVPGSFLLLVFGEALGGSVQVLQRPLLTDRRLHLWALTGTVREWRLRPADTRTRVTTRREPPSVCVCI